MWLTKQLFPQRGLRLQTGQIISGGENLSVLGESEYISPDTLFPYGFSSAAAGGGRAVMLGSYCAGTASAPDAALSEGEVRLYSEGGAEILLRSTGEVVINGQIFAPKEQEV